MRTAATPAMAYVAMALGATGLTLGDFFIKRASIDGVSIAALLLFAWPLTVGGLLLLAHLRGGIRHHLYPHNPSKLLVRAVLLLVMSLLNIGSLSLNPYSQHAMLFQLSPVFALMLGVMFMGERLSVHVLLVLVTCVAGTWLILDPGLARFSTVLLLAVAAALFNAVTNTFVAANRQAATPIGFTFYAVNGVVLIMAIYWSLFDRSIPSLNTQVWIQLSAMFAVTGIVFVSLGMQLARGNVGRVSLAFYVQMPVAVLLAWIAFGETPTGPALLGGAMIILAGASIPLLSRYRARLAAS